MSGFIPTYKIDKVDVGEGVIMQGSISCANYGLLQKFYSEFQKMITQRRSSEARGQQEIDFKDGVTIPAVTLRADKPREKQREYSIGIDMKDVSFEDRSKLFAMMQNDAIEIHVSIVGKPKRKPLKLDDDKTKADDDSKTDETKTDAPADPPASDTTTEHKTVDHSTDRLNLPSFQNDTLEERLQVALLIREGAADRWADRINAGMKDTDLSKAIDSEWKDEEYKASSEGRHFVVKPGNTPKFWLAERVGVPANMLSKPTLSGAKLLAKTREVLGFEATPKTTKGKSKAKK